MSLKKINEIKTNKFFKLWDILVYAVIAVIIVSLFLAVFLTSDTSPLSGIGIYYKGEAVFTYSFDNDEYNIVNSDLISVEEGENSLTVYFTTENGKGHNTVFVNKSAVTVSVTDADCNGKDCTLTTIKDKSGVIVCSPHYLKIIPEDYQDSDDGENIYT